MSSHSTPVVAEVRAEEVSAPYRRHLPLAAKGFRPFFLAAAAFAALILPIWLFMLAGVLAPARYLDSITWHVHEMVFGFAVAVMAGFLLTAVANWTGRETIVGRPVLGVCALWAAGRFVMACAGDLPRGVPAIVDLAFLPVLGFIVARPILATANRRSFGVLAILGGLWLANLTIHLDALGILSEQRRRAAMFSVDLVVVLLVVITGRVIPMFTRNATGVTTVRSLPSLDQAAVVSMVLVAAASVVSATPWLQGAVAALTAGLLVARAWHWGARHAVRQPLLWILHAGHAWIIAGLGLRAAAAFGASVPRSAATHALTVGAIGALTLGMMARVALGHTGRTILARLPSAAAFVLLTLAAVVRVFVPLLDASAYRVSLYVSGTLWFAAFALFLVVYVPILTSARADGKPG